MGQVASVHTLMSEDPDFNYEKLGNDLQSLVPSGIKVIRTEVKPLAFGLKMLEVTCIMQDAAGLIEELEKVYSSIEGISNVEVKEVGLI
ncbi:MAG: elongation factor 1-beta [Methanomassiliicoccales archaeon]|nr:MAG: elongation factor 1-beta [Methanomassiliicoccales archaeon]